MTVNILEYLEKSTLKSPEKIAFADEFTNLSYQQTLDLSKKIGTFLATKTQEKNRPFVVFLPKSVSSITAFFGIVYSGNFYVPLDTDLPLARLSAILSILDPSGIIADENTSLKIKELNNHCSIYIYNEMLNNIDENLLNGIRSRAIDTDPLYATFTSGSTGLPKGVVKSHSSMISFIESFSKTFPFSENDIFGNQMPFYFDASTKDIYTCIKLTSTLHIIPKKLFTFPGKLIEYLNQKKINCIIWVPSILGNIVNLNVFNYIKPLYVDKIFFVGEVMPVKYLNAWKANLPSALFVNLYGSTEIAGNCLYYIVNRDFSLSESLPVGKPFPNTDVFLLDDSNLITNSDTVGEICIRGRNVALGYYNSSDHQDAFSNNPLCPEYPDRIYRTGDLGKYNNNGEIIFISRKDFQIKHMGNRIELAEIEIAATAISFVTSAVCIYDKNNEKIILFYQSEDECKKKVFLGLKDYLPKYMLPNKLIWFNKLPLNRNMKIDRKKLFEEYSNGSI